MIQDINFAILDFIQQNMRSAFGDMVMPIVTALGNVGMIWILLGVVLLLRKSWRRAGILLLAALLVDVLLCNVLLKNIVAAPRPFQIQPAIELLIAKPTDYSFPSGHTAAAFAAVGALYFSRIRWWGAALVVAVFIAFSRLYLYVHFPTDILGGIVVGLVSAWLAWKLLAFTTQRGWQERND